MIMVIAALTRQECGEQRIHHDRFRGEERPGCCARDRIGLSFGYTEPAEGEEMPLTLIRRPMGALPAEVTGLVGRTTELAQLSALLSTARLVTVTGPGGVGKTRVALRTAASLGATFTDGACLVELSGLSDPELLPHTVATCLGLPERDTRSQLDALLDFLRERRLLLILDTCEHLVDACAMFSDVLLRETGGVTVLATSRQPLDVPGEHLCAIAPLPVLSDGQAASDAVELFSQRAAAVVPGFEVTDANRADVIRLCERLDGMPLAIELAAVRLRAVPLHQLAGRLEEHFRILTAGRRTALPRHQTLRATIEWSYDPCSAAEQLLWRRLSVFAGAFDLAGAEAVCADQSLPSDEILQTLIGLVDKSVVLRVEDGARYRMLDTIREFGAERLAEMGEQDELRGRFVRYYRAKAKYFGDNLIAEDQLPRFHELRREHANIRAALECALASPGGDVAAAELAVDLYGYWELSALHREGKHWLNRVLERFPAPCKERAWALIVRGLLGTWQGQTEQAIVDLEAGIAIAEALPAAEPAAVARGHLFLCQALAFAGQHERAIETGNAADTELRAIDDVAGLLCLDSCMGYLHLISGDAERAQERCARGLSRMDDCGAERWLHSWLYLVTALALLLKEDYAEAITAATRAAEMKYELGDVVGMAHCLDGAGWLAARQGRYERAAWMLGAAAPYWELSGTRLSGDPILEAFHAEAADAARNELGQERYEQLWQQGATTPLERVIEIATRDANVPSAGPSAAGDGTHPNTAIAVSALTRREREIAGLVTDGMSNREIAERLVISKRTVDAHVEHIFAKLGVSSRVQVATWMRSAR
jgi:predicted ATPase/DNA-binding CsgD family transcriptional regulator